MVCCCTFSSMCKPTAPFRSLLPKIGGFSPATVPRPGFPLSRRRRPSRPGCAPLSGGPLCPATPYPASPSTSPLSSTGFFSPPLPRAPALPSLDPPRHSNPVRRQAAGWINSSPSSTHPRPTFSTAGAVPRRDEVKFRCDSRAIGPADLLLEWHAVETLAEVVGRLDFDDLRFLTLAVDLCLRQQFV